jgi:putative NIF3 family GTP cyclohydrolase 1 type 2
MDSSAQVLKVRQVIDKMTTTLGTKIKSGSVDTLKSGTWDIQVTGIATTFMATWDVLKQAHALGTNLILTHEPTFYNHLDNLDHYGADDPLVNAKRKYIDDHNLVVFRWHDVPHQVEEDQIKKGMVKKLGWDHLHEGNMIFRSEFSTLLELATFLKNHFQTSTLRVVGNPDMKINKIAFLPGAYGAQQQVEKYLSPFIDVLIVGESREWETIEYARDAQEFGIHRALIVMGHADSEEAGMLYVADWLEKLFPTLPIKYIPARNPLWSPE